MVEMPEDKVTMEELFAWYKAKQSLATARENEMAMRKRIARFYFPDPKEGVNKTKLPDGSEIKMTHKITRDMDEAVYTNILPSLFEAGLQADEFAKFKPQLVLTKYRELEKAVVAGDKAAIEQKALFDQCLTMKPGSPDLTITPPKGK